MKCVKCNSELPDGANFCNACGASQEVPKTEAMKKCARCGAELPVSFKFCDSCGAPQNDQCVPPPPTAPVQQQFPPQYAQMPQQQYAPDVPPKSLFVYQVLAVFLGVFGVHNFYAGRPLIGGIQLLISWTGASAIWALIEIIAVKTDGLGRPMVVGGHNPKTRNKYCWLALLLGALGIHDFYAGYSVLGFVHLVLCCTGFGYFASAIWSLVEIFAVRKDSEGVVMELKRDKACGITSIACALFLLIFGFILPMLRIRVYFAYQNILFISCQILCLMSALVAIFFDNCLMAGISMLITILPLAIFFVTPNCYCDRIVLSVAVVVLALAVCGWLRQRRSKE